MTAALDHLVVCAATLEEGAAAVEAALGVAPGPGGRHALMGTHNRLLSLGPDAYLEVIAIDPEVPDPGRARWYGLDGFDGPARLAAWAVRVDDLGAALAEAPEGAGEALDLSRGDLRWRMGVPVSGVTPADGAHPMLLQWLTEPPMARLPDEGCRLASLTVTAPRPHMLAPLLGRLADPRVAVEPGSVGLTALIEAPGGPRTL